ncbi:MAG: hypothetical protein J6Q89_03720 [Clostridia bacterium]|nr:hypothetical protein [Clostridia bacterium]
MRKEEVIAARKNWLIRHNSYAFTFWKYFDYEKLERISYIGRGKDETFNDVIIMCDTETSKETPGTVCRNYVVAWTISVRAYDMNIVTLYGTRPSEMIDCIEKMVVAMPGEKTIFYFHNLSYDWVFLRKFMFRKWGLPVHQLNTKSHYPVFITFANGITFRDSLILAQRSLEKWASDLDVKHKKASGFWDYDKIRNQGERFNPHEKTYIEHDTLAGVECIQKTMDTLNKRIYAIPYTATGIVREAVRKIGKENRARERFLRIVPEYEIQLILECVFHGGYVHNNRYYVEKIIRMLLDAYDFASSYPFEMLAGKVPMEKFKPLNKVVSPEFILQNMDNYGYLIRLVMVKPKLKHGVVMPVLQRSKMVRIVNSVEDNGRVLCAAYAEIWINELDLDLIVSQYEFETVFCTDVYFSRKDYMPKWYTDYVYQCFVDKTKLKTAGDPVAYAMAKGRINSLYGMLVQRPVKLMIEEQYLTGEYDTAEDQDEKALYEKYVNNHNSILPYQWGVWITSGSMYRLFKLGAACSGQDESGNPRIWLYSDTDSAYGVNWNKEALAAYNEECKQKLLARGYGAVLHNGREYWLGVAELDGTYTEFVSVGAKRYAVRDAKTGKLKITVAGVPKSGVNCLHDDLRNFHAGFIFDGATTGKKQHTYFYENDITTDANGNERGDSIDLSPANYLLDSVRNVDYEKIFREEISIQVYE